MPGLKNQLLALIAGISVAAVPALADPNHTTNKPDHNKPDHKPNTVHPDHKPNTVHPDHNGVRPNHHVPVGVVGEGPHGHSAGGTSAHPHLEAAKHDLQEARNEFREGNDLAAAKDLGKALQQALSAAKYEASKNGTGSLAILPTPPATQHASGSTGGSPSHGATGQTGSGGHHDHLQQAIEYLKEARIAVRRDEDRRAEHEIHEAFRELAEAGHHHQANTNSQGSSGKSTSTHQAGSQSVGNKGMTSSGSAATQQTNGTAGTSQHRALHVEEAARFMHGAVRNINQGNDGRAEIDLHDAIAKLHEARSHQ